MVVLALSVAAFGQTVVQFDIDEQRAAELGLDGAAIRDALAERINDEFNLPDIDAFLDAFARAAAMSAKGMGVDYASNADKFVVGAAMGAAVSGRPLTFDRGEEVPESGFAAMTAIHGGLNLGVFGSGDPNFLDRIRVYASGLGFRTPSDRALRGRMLNIGFHGQLELVTPKEMGKLAEWGGLALTTGFEHASYEIELSGELPISHTVQGAQLTWVASGAYAIRTSATTIPLELSTNIRFVPLTAFGGVGWDFDIASASTDASLSGDVNAAVGGGSEDIGSGTVSFDSPEGQGNPYQVRGFFGAQVALYAFKLFGQLNFGANQTYGGYAGFRVAM